ncbi:DUF5723 family protein [Carboxylicivirga sp. RSCT41]|uniref:DUF5723 family protein n=1 Tax=Carboxylicivirga agarovorans TaxID=3417570 RepID=UPI003D337A93
MKRLFLLLHIACLFFVGRAQEFTGIHTSPYTPFIGIVNQPAELTRHDATWNINVLSGDIGLIRDFNLVSADFWDVIARVGMGDLKYFLASEESLLYVKGRLIVPSLTFKLNDKHSFGISTNVRADGVYNSSNDDLLKIFQGIENPEYFEDINNEYFRSLLSSWVEYDFVWSTTIFKDNNRWLTGGVVVKILNGSGAGYLEMDDIDINFDKESIAHLDMEMSYGFNESLSKTIDGGDIVEQSGDFGIGLDLGLSYSYLPEHLMGVKGIPYRYKLGFVVSDIGKIKHKSTKNQASYFVKMDDVPYSRFRGVETLEALKDSIEKSIDYEEIKGGGFETNLPITIAANVDYCIRPHLFVNTTVLLRPNYYTKLVKLIQKNVWRTNVTMRYEKRKWGVYLPLTYSNVLGWNMGLSARYGNFFMGSSTILDNILSGSNDRQVLFFGMSIPIYSSNQ